MPTYPTVAKTWTITPNNVITFVSLVLTTAGYMKGVADFLLAHGYTCKGSCDGTTGAMDGVNRWTTTANAAIRGANTTTANSWMVLTDGNGCNILLSFVGASDDIARFSFSPGGNYVAAGTPNQTPTATDERLISSTITVIDATASGNRIWNGWVDSQSKMCRFCVLRNSINVGPLWGVELVNPRTPIAQTFSPAVWGFCYIPANFSITQGTGFPGGFSANSRGGVGVIGSVNASFGGMMLIYGNNSVVWQDVQTEIQGGVGYPMFGPLGIASATSTMQGPVAYLFDWFTGRGTTNAGTTYGSSSHTKEFVQWCDASKSGLVWPWDGTTTPTVT